MEYVIINFIKENRYLYDRTDPRYKCALTKNAKWKELSDRLGIEVPQLKKRWKTLRDRFRREDKTFIKKGSLGKIKWRYYNHLEFLKGYFEDTETVFLPSEDYTTRDNQTYHEFGELSKGTIVEMQEDSQMSPLKKPDEYTSDQTQSPPQIKKARAKNITKREIFQDMNSLIEKMQGSFQSKSMVHAFFNSMAIQVEQANLSFDRLAYVQQEVLRIINQQIREQIHEQSGNGVEY